METSEPVRCDQAELLHVGDPVIWTWVINPDTSPIPGVVTGTLDRCVAILWEDNPHCPSTYFFDEAHRWQHIQPKPEERRYEPIPANRPRIIKRRKPKP